MNPPRTISASRSAFSKNPERPGTTRRWRAVDSAAATAKESLRSASKGAFRQPRLLRLGQPRSIFCALALGLFSPGAFGQWTSVGDGIDYQQFSAAGPNRLFVTRMARTNANAFIDTTIANDLMAGSFQTVRNQAARADDALSWWGGTWGARNKVVVAINGGFYNTSSGVISGGQIKSGWYAHWFADSFSGFAWKLNRTPFIGQCVSHLTTKVYVRFVANGATEPIDGVNRTNAASDLVIFTPQWGRATPAGTRTEVVVEMTRPNLTTAGTGYSSGTIRSVTQNIGGTLIPFDQLVLSADGSEGTTLNNNASVGGEIRIFQELVDKNEPDVQGNFACQNTTGQDWSSAFASINSNFHFLENGVVRVPDAVAHPGYQGYVDLNPRTAICYNANYVFFVVCDGRSGQSVGMSCATLGTWAQAALGATDGVNLDGGGSSTLVVNGVVKNAPSDGPERAVCNGVLMLNLASQTNSTTFGAGQAVTTAASASLYLGPGANYYTVASVAKSALGTVVGHALGGIYAKGNFWWKCSFSGNTGWIAQSSLVIPANAPSIAQQPADQTVVLGGSTTFTALASGSAPLAYRWQKNLANMVDGGHYSGCTNSTLTIVNADTNDAAGYRCVVTNAYGGATSSIATLTIGQAFGTVALTNIPPLAGDTANEARAITPDGRWIAGISGARGFLYNSTNLYNVISSDAAQSAGVNGVAYRSVSGQNQIVVSGLYGGRYAAWMTADQGATWGVVVQGGTGKSPAIPLANGVAGTASDLVYSIWTDEGTGATDNWTLNVGQFSGPWPATVAWGPKSAAKPDTLQLNAIASNGRGVGWRRNGTTLVYANYVADYQGATTPAVWNFNGLDGTTAGQAFSVSADGRTLFGISPKPGSGSVNYGYKVTFNSTFPGAATQLSIAQLPNFPDAGGSASLAIPYGCTPDGVYAVGMNYRGLEKAVLWDTSNTNAARWAMVDLTDVAAANGILGIFTRLNRAYSVATNSAGALVIVGAGLDASSNTRAFLMTLTPPLAPITFPPTITVAGSYPAGFTFSFLSPSNAGIIYYLESATNLNLPIAWTTIDSTSGTGTRTVLSDPNPPSARAFYRVRIQ